MAQKIAVDVALLPSEDMMDRAIEANKRYFGNSNNEIKLNKVDCLPHTTLAMGCIKKSDIDKIDKILNRTVKGYTTFHLQTTPTKERKSWFRIKDNENLRMLHECIMKDLSDYFTYDVEKEMLYTSSKEEFNDTTLRYIKEFPIKWSFENYKPHITVGFEDIEMSLPQIEFTASKLAMCQLGNHCTCRKIFLSYTLI